MKGLPRVAGHHYKGKAAINWTPLSVKSKGSVAPYSMVKQGPFQSKWGQPALDHVWCTLLNWGWTELQSVSVSLAVWIIHLHEPFQCSRIRRMYRVPLMSNAVLIRAGTTKGNYEWSKLFCSSFKEDRHWLRAGEHYDGLRWWWWWWWGCIHTLPENLASNCQRLPVV